VKVKQEAAPEVKVEVKLEVNQEAPPSVKVGVKQKRHRS
jgi:hypothetical protein